MEHIQLMFRFQNPRTVAGVMQLLQIGNVEAVADCEAYLKYCTNYTN